MGTFLLENTNRYLAQVHDENLCEGNPCTIHNRTNHSMRSFKQHWRSDRCIMERICPHGIGHPDPDEHKLTIDSHEKIHGCDGCCSEAYN